MGGKITRELGAWCEKVYGAGELIYCAGSREKRLRSREQRKINREKHIEHYRDTVHLMTPKIYRLSALDPTFFTKVHLGGKA